MVMTNKEPAEVFEFIVGIRCNGQGFVNQRATLRKLFFFYKNHPLYYCLIKVQSENKVLHYAVVQYFGGIVIQLSNQHLIHTFAIRMIFKNILNR